MALAYALSTIDRGAIADATLTNYGQFLRPPPGDLGGRDRERTSWSCAHGVERWRSDCGCNGGHGGWNQAGGRRCGALDWLRDQASDGDFEQAALGLLRDPWAARDDYVDAMLDRDRTSTSSSATTPAAS
jgi:hypothetical protein